MVLCGLGKEKCFNLLLQVIVTRKIGDQTHTFTKRKDESGNEETQEDLVNIENNGMLNLQLHALYTHRLDFSQLRT